MDKIHQYYISQILIENSPKFLCALANTSSKLNKSYHVEKSNISLDKFIHHVKYLIYSGVEPYPTRQNPGFDKWRLQKVSLSTPSPKWKPSKETAARVKLVTKLHTVQEKYKKLSTRSFYLFLVSFSPDKPPVIYTTVSCEIQRDLKQLGQYSCQHYNARPCPVGNFFEPAATKNMNNWQLTDCIT